MKSMLRAALAALLFAVPAGLTAQTQLGLGVDTANFDRSVRPQDDFYQFVNGTWLKKTEMPADKSRYGAFTALSDKSDAAVRAIIEEAAAQQDAAPGSEIQKIGDYYASYMDTVRIEELGAAPIQPMLARIAAVDSHADLPLLFAELVRTGLTGPLGIFVGPDMMASTQNTVYATQTGLGLPDREYYLKQDANFDHLRKAYVEYMERMLSLAGVENAAAAAPRILDLETKIATIQWDRAKNRDRNLTYNKHSVAEFAALMPRFDWNAYIDAAGLGAATDVVVRQPDYVQALDALIAETPIEDWKNYFSMRLIAGAAPLLSSDFVNANFEFNGRILRGIPEMEPRWKRGVSQTQSVLGEAIGKVYVERHFQPEARVRMAQLVNNLRAAFDEGIDELEWMNPATQAEARDKLQKFTVKIGFPEEWEDYSALEIRRGDLVGNRVRGSMFDYEDMISRLGKPVDKAEWGMTPQTVNAYYNSVNNEIVFPAAILQPPFFDFTADDAVNYGAIGAVIGHEISHGFDDQGRKSDGAGNLRDWWTDADAKAFEERANKLVAQYAAYSPIEGMNVNGKLTLGENIGDLSGLAVAYRAYQLSLNGEKAPVIDGFTGEQRFFMGWAQVWRTLYRDEELRNRLLTDSHALSMYRTNGVLVNMPAFYEAWGVKQGDKMYLPDEQRIRIW